MHELNADSVYRLADGQVDSADFGIGEIASNRSGDRLRKSEAMAIGLVLLFPNQPGVKISTAFFGTKENSESPGCPSSLNERPTD